jgi:hypothetical protein
MIYELREYVAHENAVQHVHDRFRTWTLPIFERHGLDVQGFWVDEQDPNRILYLLQFADAEAQERAWEGFKGDVDWKKAKADSEAAGPIVAQMTTRTLKPVPYWPREPTTNDEGRKQP